MPHLAFTRYYQPPFYKDLEPNVIFNNPYLFVRFYPLFELTGVASSNKEWWSSKYILEITVQPAFGSICPALEILNKSLAEVEDEIDISSISKVVYRQTGLNGSGYASQHGHTSTAVWRDLVHLATLIKSPLFQGRVIDAAYDGIQTQGSVQLSLLYINHGTYSTGLPAQQAPGTTLQIEHGDSTESFGLLSIPLDELADSQQTDTWFSAVMPYIDRLHITAAQNPEQCHPLSIKMQLQARLADLSAYGRLKALYVPLDWNRPDSVVPSGEEIFFDNSLDDVLKAACGTSVLRELVLV